MRRSARLLPTIALAVVALVATAAALGADPCAHRGRLDPLYCDDNRDGLADPPKDAAKVVSPDPLVFTYAPVEDPAVYEGAWSDFLKHIEKITGKRTKYYGLQNDAAQIEAMRSGRLHISAYSTGEIPALAQYFVRRYCQIFRREPFALAPETVQRLTQHRYAGNVRELENIVKRMIALDDPFLAKNSHATLPQENTATSARQSAR